ncbi:hypothetical protein PROFUN_15958 [Planoprotostelium fungivorum]|uniref:Uncharacterized protein n=1 Tax=Planoprotostelium fungivorum TaxID=1890364 RepID=A0A2P6MU02_9EUKA|nr:hypothetical protein PROFUN_15958 [Planoprotostelium fungivorum]
MTKLLNYTCKTYRKIPKNRTVCAHTLTIDIGKLHYIFLFTTNYGAVKCKIAVKLAKDSYWLQKKGTFLGCVAKHTPPEYNTVALFVCPAFNSFSHTEFLNPLYGTILRPPHGMKIQHLPKGIREISEEREWSRCKEQNQEKNSAGSSS